jgi:hypothetical protein
MRGHCKDNVPISYTEWKGKAINPYMVLNTDKDTLWVDIKKYFTLHEDVNDNLIKGWTLSKMATQFHNFKKNLDRDFIKKGLTPK